MRRWTVLSIAIWEVFLGLRMHYKLQPNSNQSVLRGVFTSDYSVHKVAIAGQKTKFLTKSRHYAIWSFSVNEPFEKNNAVTEEPLLKGWISTVNLLALTSLNQLFFIENTFYNFYETNYLN
jgi:hypothetical protein